MIGSHNSFTYLSSTNDLFNRFTSLWKCQEITVVEQYKMGVRFFDIRVKAELKDDKNVWRSCHGIVDVDKAWVSLKSICSYCEKSLKGSMYRIVLEKDDNIDQFKKEIAALAGNSKFPGLIEVVIKSNWEYVYVSNNHPKIIDYNYEYWHTDKGFLDNIINFIKNIGVTLRSWAEENNPKITQEMIDDPNTIHFMDFVNLGQK